MLSSIFIVLMPLYSFLRLAPSFVLSTAFRILQERVMQYTQTQVSAKFIESFLIYEQTNSKNESLLASEDFVKS